MVHLDITSCFFVFGIRGRRKKLEESGKGPNRVRTGDLLICSQMLYHWAMDPFLHQGLYFFQAIIHLSPCHVPTVSETRCVVQVCSYVFKVLPCWRGSNYWPHNYWPVLCQLLAFLFYNRSIFSTKKWYSKYKYIYVS